MDKLNLTSTSFTPNITFGDNLVTILLANYKYKWVDERKVAFPDTVKLNPSLNNSVLQRICESCPKLSKLDISGSKFLFYLIFLYFIIIFIFYYFFLFFLIFISKI